MAKLLRPDLVKKLQQLAVSVLRPSEIVALEAWVDGETRALDLRESVLGMFDEETILRRALVAEAKRQLDGLYIEWAKQELSLEQRQPTT